MNARQQLDALVDRCVDVVSRDDLAARLKEGRPLRVKFGIDPSGPMLHLGHAVVLRQLRAFQDCGHKAVLVVGDFTARIGDPTGRENSRKPRTREEIEADMRSYAEQASSIIDIDAAERPLQQRLARQARIRGHHRLGGSHDGGAHARTRRLQQALRRRRRDRTARVPLPARRRVRLGRSRCGRRTWRHGTALQPAHGPAAPRRPGQATADLHDAADSGRHGWRAAHGQEPEQLHRAAR